MSSSRWMARMSTSMSRSQDGETHLVCGVDLTYRASPEWAEERDDVQDQVYSDDLDHRAQRAVEARLGAPRPVVSGAGGPMTPPWTASPRPRMEHL